MVLSGIQTGAATVRVMSYFRAPELDDRILEMSERNVVAAEELVAKAEEAAARMGRSGSDLAASLVDESRRHLDKARHDRETKLQERETRAAELQTALSAIRGQAVLDAEVAWRAGDAFFAAVLFQPLERAGDGWEVALSEVIAIGWRLDSWQVIGPAPSPFEGRVTLIQTLFVR